MWKTIPCFGKLTSQPSFSHAKMTPISPPILPRTKLPTCTNHLRNHFKMESGKRLHFASMLAIGIRPTKNVQKLSRRARGRYLDDQPLTPCCVESNEVAYLHVISPFCTYNIASDGVTVNGSNVREMSSLAFVVCISSIVGDVAHGTIADCGVRT